MYSDSAKKLWQLKSYDEDLARKISEELGICTNTAALLCLRGIDSTQSAKHFLRKETCSFYNPFLIKDMDEAADRLILAIRNNEKICIYGDYDVDGITSTSLLSLYLESKGICCTHYIPNRNSEGYGMNIPAIESIAKNGTSLIVTVDTGVTAVEEIDFGKSLGLDFVVTDHHECKEEIPSCIVVNPCRHDCTYPYKALAGVGVVFKLICAVEMALENKKDEVPADLLSRLFTEYAQIVALGTVADVMPATDENRLIISIGLSMMQKSPEPWCRSILDFYGFYGKKGQDKQISSSTIGYIIAPRINAAGRIGDVELAVNLFLTKSKAESDAYASELCELNRKRQIMENEIVEEAVAMIDSSESDDPFIILSSDNWHQGIIGIVASRLSERYSKPCILITFSNEDTLSGKGSGRSVPGISLYDALEYSSEHLVKFGGHELAAGLTVSRENLDGFKKKINEYARNNTFDKDECVPVEVDCEPSPAEINSTVAKELRLLEPFGYGNPSPLFMISNARISDITPLGNDKHCRFTLTKNGYSFQAVFFGMPASKLGFCNMDTVDVLYSMEINCYAGKENLQLIVKDIRANKALTEYISSQEELYNRIIENNVSDDVIDDSVIPTRDDFKAVYLHILRLLGREPKIFDYAYIARSLCATGYNIDVCKARLILDIFKEKELIELESLTERTVKLSRCDKLAPGMKVSLDGSQILISLREMKKRNN